MPTTTPAGAPASPAAAAPGPDVRADAVTFRLSDPSRRLRGVRLRQEVRVPGDRLDFVHRRGTWSLTLPRPDVDRMEYLFELAEPDGPPRSALDPANPRRSPGAFGEKSVIEFPGYVAPAWLAGPRTPGSSIDVAVPSRALGATVHGSVWSPDTLPAEVPAPLLVVHDGPEFASLGGVLSWAAAQVAAGGVPPLRVALLAPGDRNQWYSANPAYARALTGEVLPALPGPVTVRIGVGASLGALALLHAHRHAPGSFDALFLQSGSFFLPTLDPQESRFARFGPVTRFVAELEQAVADAAPVPTVLTCGLLEENLGNNQAMTSTLQRLAYPAHLVPVRDVHNFTAWRDALDPHLTGLVRGVVGTTR